MHGKEMAVFIPKLSYVHLSEYSQFILELKSTIFIVSELKKLYSPFVPLPQYKAQQHAELFPILKRQPIIGVTERVSSKRLY